MGSIKKTFFGVFILLIGHLTYFYVFRKDNPRIDIYFDSKSFPKSKMNYYYFLGKLPPKYYQDFEEKIIHKDNQCKLINIIRKRHPNYHNYIVLNKGSKEYLLKNSDSLFYHIQGGKNLISSQIDIEVFNKYLKCNNITDSNEIMNTFFYLSSTIGGDASYRVDYDSLPSYIPIKKYNDYNSIELNIDSNFTENLVTDLQFNPNTFQFDEDNCYCWFKDKGIFKFNFVIKKDTVVNVTDIFLGYTGAEKW